MIKIALTNKLVNALTRKVISKVLAKKLGDDAKVVINELSAVEENGRVKVILNAQLDLSNEAAEKLIDTL